MTLPNDWLNHKTLMIALLQIARRIAARLEIPLETPVSEMCAKLNANRTSVYEQAKRIVEAIQGLIDARPGRPAHSAREHGEGASSKDTTGIELRIQILEFRLQHPGALERRGARTTYADPFKRFLLELLDSWQGNDQDFARAADIPLDTIRDWKSQEQKGFVQPPEENLAPPPIPRSASKITHQIAQEWHQWIGSTREFLRHTATKLRLSTQQIQRVLKILGLLRGHRKNPFRYRGTTHPLTPGACLVTDGKQIRVHLEHSNTTLHRTWQAIVDQTTGCHTACVLTDEESAHAALEAFEASCHQLGKAPDALLHDNKPCYTQQHFQKQIQKAGTSLLPATHARPQNKAIIEGDFGLFEQRIATVNLDDTTMETLIHSAVREVVRAYTQVTNSVPRIQWQGKSRSQILHDVCPNPEQRARDRRFLQRLKARHTRPPRRPVDPTARRLLDEIFRTLDLEENDPKGKLRHHLARFNTAAIRRAAAIVTAKLRQGDIQKRYAHRYLAKVIASQQDLLDLEIAAEQLLELCRLQNEDWTHQEQLHFDALERDLQDPQDLAKAVAERAAHGGIPIQETFWTHKLLELLEKARHCIQSIKKYLIRLYEAPFQNRLALLDRITAFECNLA